MAELGEHFQAGRLDSEEFGQRLEAAGSARTRGDLDRLMADLPRTAAPQQPPAPRGPRHAVPVAAVVAMAVAIAIALLAIGGEFAHGPGHAHWGWGVTWWVIVIPILLLRRLLWRGNGGRGPR